MATLRPTFHSTSQVFWIVAFGFQSECSCVMKKHVRNTVITKAFKCHAPTAHTCADEHSQIWCTKKSHGSWSWERHPAALDHRSSFFPRIYHVFRLCDLPDTMKKKIMRNLTSHLQTNTIQVGRVGYMLNATASCGEQIVLDDPFRSQRAIFPPSRNKLFTMNDHMFVTNYR